jgi:hypothetical protein
MVRVSPKQVDQLITKYNIDTKIVSKDTLIYAIKVELEHGKRFGAITNIINDDIELALRIVIAHLLEASNYYTYLKRMETKLDTYWKGRAKKSIFLPSKKDGLR